MLCTICARGGSKGVPNKNIRLLSGKPLIAYTIEQALECGLFDCIVVSTDSEKIASIARQYGAKAWFLRPEKLAADGAAKISAIRHALLKSEKHFNQKFDVHVDLDATSPLRDIKDIQDAYNQFIQEGSDILITGSPARKNPYFNMVELIDGRPKLVKSLSEYLVCRQDAPTVYDLNASIYIWRKAALLAEDTVFTNKTSLYIMPEERSVDIDTEIDFKIVESLMQLRHSQKNIPSTREGFDKLSG